MTSKRETGQETRGGYHKLPYAFTEQGIAMLSGILRSDVAIDTLAKRGRGVKVELVTHSNGQLAESDFEAFAKQCGNFMKTLCGICHDRFIIVDQKEIFWTGASLKDAGRLTFAAAKMGAEMIPGLLASIRKATSERRTYGKGKEAK